MNCHWRLRRKMMACKPYTAAIMTMAMTGTAPLPVATVTMR